jgi:pimeloyl-ACP methyl ester carboxylesterase
VSEPAPPAAAGPRTVRLRAPDGPVRVRVWPASPPAGPHDPALLAFHGWMEVSDVFAPLVSALRHRWTVIAPDAPSHGGTPQREGRYVVADHVTSAQALLDSLAAPELAGRGHSTAIAYGHSMGALTAARLAATRPERVRGLVLEEPARTTLRRSLSTARMRTWTEGLRSGSHEDRVAWLRANHPDWPAAELGPWARSKVAVDLTHLDRPVDWGEPLPALLSEVHCPVLIIRGQPERGGIVSKVAARRCVDACPGGGRVLALEAGHSPRREAPAEFYEALRQVLSAW